MATGIRRCVETIEENDPAFGILESAILTREETSLFVENGGEFYIRHQADVGMYEVFITPQKDITKRGMVHTLVYSLSRTAIQAAPEKVAGVISLIYTHIEALQSA